MTTVQPIDVAGNTGTILPVVATQAFDLSLVLTVGMFIIAGLSFVTTLIFNLLRRRDQKEELAVRKLEVEAELNRQAGAK